MHARKIRVRPGVIRWQVKSRGRFGNRDGYDRALRVRRFRSHAEALDYVAEVWDGERLTGKLAGMLRDGQHRITAMARQAGPPPDWPDSGAVTALARSGAAQRWARQMAQQHEPGRG
jgi:hypothetical protein